MPIKLLLIIVNAGYADDVIGLARDEGAGGATVLNARGEGQKHEVFMGITVDAEKEMILCLAPEDTADRIMAVVRDRAGIKTPAHSVCLTLPVEKMVGLSAPFPQEDQQEK